MGTVRTTPLSKFNVSEALFSRAFPTCFPTGAREWTKPQQRYVDYPSYVRHMLLYKDGRIARHPRFRYVAFNTIMRKQVNVKSGFFMSRTPNDHTMSLEDLRRAFEDDSPHSAAMLNSIVRFSGSLRGTRPFWVGKGKSLKAMVSYVASTLKTNTRLIPILIPC